MPFPSDTERPKFLCVFCGIELDTLRGKYCKEEQEAGNGPCGACIPCYQARIKELEDTLERVVQWPLHKFIRVPKPKWRCNVCLEWGDRYNEAHLEDCGLQRVVALVINRRTKP